MPSFIAGRVIKHINARLLVKIHVEVGCQRIDLDTGDAPVRENSIRPCGTDNRLGEAKFLTIVAICESNGSATHYSPRN